MLLENRGVYDADQGGALPYGCNIFNETGWSLPLCGVARDGRRAEEGRRRGQIRDLSGGWPHALSVERVGEFGCDIGWPVIAEQARPLLDRCRFRKSYPDVLAMKTAENSI
jgi:hypothetical protein